MARETFCILFTLMFPHCCYEGRTREMLNDLSEDISALMHKYESDTDIALTVSPPQISNRAEAKVSKDVAM